MDAATACDRLARCGLPDQWAKMPAWTVLDTAFAGAEQFLATWHAWQQDPCRPRMLHYVGISSHSLHIAVGPAEHLPDRLQPLAQTLATHCASLGVGFHRIILEHGQVSLTLCIGNVKTVLGEQVFQADTVFSSAPTDKWAAQLLGRRCKRGTRLCLFADATHTEGSQVDFLRCAGFDINDPQATPDCIVCSYSPRWTLRTSRGTTQPPATAAARCAVVGAGIAGASVAHALALRGWQVRVFDRDATPASGASGLPAGLVVPHLSVDDNPRSRLSRHGTRVMAQHARNVLLRGQDWEPSGVLERRDEAATLWHPDALWMRPTALIRAWLQRSGVSFVGNTEVAALARSGDAWVLRDVQGQELARAELVVLANALGGAKLLASAMPDCAVSADLRDNLERLQALHGTLSHGVYAEELPGLPDTPVNGKGYFIPHLPGAQGEGWLIGSTFEADARKAADLWSQHAANLIKLESLLPDTGRELAAHLERAPVALWSATRCVTRDRLPLVGPVDAVATAGLWLCIGMGSRGLSLAPLCAELLAARVGGEPWPIESTLARSLDPHRVRRQRNRGRTPQDFDAPHNF